jgi:hypothetical protein
VIPGHESDLARELLSLCMASSRPGGGADLTRQPSADPRSRGGLECPPSLDWDALIRLAIEQGVAPLLAVRTRHLRLPVPVRERLESIYSSNSIRNLRLAAEESRISAALGAAGLRHWPLKGPTLSERLYGDIGVRQIADLDLLVEPANFAHADALLASLGYVRQTAGKIESLARAQELVYVRNSTAPASYLDLHQRLLPYVRRDPLAARVFADGMTRENLLLYLCANQITHRFARLRYLCDVTACLEREGASLSWDAFLDAARRMPWGPGIGLALGWAAEFAPSSVPSHVLRALRPNPLGDLLLRRSLGDGAAEAVSRRPLLDGPGGASVSLGAAYLGRPTAARIAWQMMFPSRAYLREQTGAPAGEPLLPAYAARLMRKIPAALRHLLKATP